MFQLFILLTGILLYILYGKNFGEKAAAKDWRKKLWQMLTCIANCQSSINNKTERINFKHQ